MNLKNGCAMSSTGWRLIAFKQDGSLAPVVWREERGYLTDRGTYQVANVGDIVALNIWNSREQRLYLLKVTRTRNCFVLGSDCPDPSAWETLWEGPSEAAFSGQKGAPDMTAFYSFLNRTEGRTTSFLNEYNRGDAE